MTIIAAGATISLAVLHGAMTCPSEMPPGSTCTVGRDTHGFWAIAVPPRWNHELIIYDKGGPGFAPPLSQANAPTWKGMISRIVSDGYAVAAPSYRDGFFHFDDYAEDNEAVRHVFIERFGAPRRTLLFGTSFGAEVANRTAEHHSGAYDGVLLDAGTQSGLFPGFNWLDFRVVYQCYCGNWPRATERRYSLWQGDPATSRTFFSTPRSQQMPAIEKWWDRGRECTGFDHPASERSATQRRALSNILAVTRETEGDFQTEMSATALQLGVERVSRLTAGTRSATATPGTQNRMTTTR